jgi:hypothetical protein
MQEHDGTFTKSEKNRIGQLGQFGPGKGHHHNHQIANLEPSFRADKALQTQPIDLGDGKRNDHKSAQKAQKTQQTVPKDQQWLGRKKKKKKKQCEQSKEAKRLRSIQKTYLEIVGFAVFHVLDE